MFFRFVIIIALLPSVGWAEQTHVAVASNFATPMKKIIELFELETGDKVLVSYASSGKIATQIVHGAPFSLFLSADKEKPQWLVQKKFANASTLKPYAWGKLVFWFPRATKVDRQVVQGFVKNTKFSMANPKLAPYGLAAQQTLMSLVNQSSEVNNAVIGENISQAFQFVFSESVKGGFVALSQVKHLREHKNGNYWNIPQSMYQPIEQQMVLLNKGKNNRVAHRLWQYMQSERVQKIIADFGYDTLLSKNENIK